MAEPSQSQLIFELRGGSTAAGQELLGAWSLAPTLPAEAMPFGTRSAPSGRSAGSARSQDGVGSSPTLWRAELPGDPRLAARRLAIAGENLAASRQALVQATIRLDAVCRSAAGHQPDVSFAPATTREAPHPERELERLLLEMARDRGAVDFGVRKEVVGRWVQIGEEFQAFFRRLEQQVGHYAWVETRDQGRLWARTEVDWTGDSDTFWSSPIVPAQVELHRQTLALALEARQALLHTMVLVTRGAARLANLPILLSTPWSALLAPAVAWKFIQDVRAELEARRARVAR